MDADFAGWCGQSIPAGHGKAATARRDLIRAEAPGYIAMLAFLCAYLLSVTGADRLIQAALNLLGASVGAIYLRKKAAIPSVISNLAWAVITVGGLILGS